MQTIYLLPCTMSFAAGPRIGERENGTGSVLTYMSTAGFVIRDSEGPAGRKPEKFHVTRLAMQLHVDVSMSRLCPSSRALDQLEERALSKKRLVV